jgi:hypothetical protein
MNQLPVARCSLFVLTAFVLSNLFVSCAKQTSPEGFKWGSSRKQVVHRIGREPAQRETFTLVYPVVVGGFPMQKGYMFADDRLAGISYIYAMNDSLPAPALHLFKLLSDSMTRRFGEGRDSLADEGSKAVRRWQTNTSRTQLFFFENKVMLSHESIKYGPALERQLESAASPKAE